jgi:hypothetical protein
LPAFKPLFERLLTLTRWFPGKKPLNTYVFIDILPVDSLTFSDKSPVCSFLWAGVLKARIPSQGDGNSTPVTEVNGESVLGRANIHRIGDFNFNG